MWFLQVIVLGILLGGAYVMGMDKGSDEERKRQERLRWYRDRQCH